MSNNKQVFTRVNEEFSSHFDAAPKAVKTVASYNFDDFLEKLKEDGLTLEMLEALPSKVPVFMCLHQVDLHCNFSKSQVREMANYRHGSYLQSNFLLIRYNVIDIKKKKMLNEWLQFVCAQKEDCMVPTLIKEEAMDLGAATMNFQLTSTSLQELRQVYDRINTSLFYGRKEIIKLSDPSGELETSFILNVSIGAMKEENMWDIFTNWTGMTPKQYDTLKKKVEKQQLELEQACEANYNAAIAQLEHLPTWGGRFNNNIILATGLKDKDSVGFQFIKLQTGEKSMISVYAQVEAELDSFDPEVYERNKDLTQEELNKILQQRTWFIYDVGDRTPKKVETKQQPKQRKQKEAPQTAAPAPAEAAPFELIYYSDKSAALFGDTRPYKDVLNKDPYRGVYNGSLTHPETNKKVKGWLFTLDPKRIEAVEKLLSIKLRTANQNIAA